MLRRKIRLALFCQNRKKSKQRQRMGTRTERTGTGTRLKMKTRVQKRLKLLRMLVVLKAELGVFHQVPKLPN